MQKDKQVWLFSCGHQSFACHRNTRIHKHSHYESASGGMLFVTNVRYTSERQSDKVNLPLADVRGKLGQYSHSVHSVCLWSPMNSTSQHFFWFWVFVMLEALQIEILRKTALSSTRSAKKQLWGLARNHNNPADTVVVFQGRRDWIFLKKHHNLSVKTNNFSL